MVGLLTCMQNRCIWASHKYDGFLEIDYKLFSKIRARVALEKLDIPINMVSSKFQLFIILYNVLHTTRNTEKGGIGGMSVDPNWTRQSIQPRFTTVKRRTRTAPYTVHL